MTPPNTDGETGGRFTALSDGRTYEIPDGGLSIGRDADCDVVLGSLRVSRRHARVVPTPSGYALIDESTNGVVVNGVRIDRTTVLRQGDIIGVGEEAFRFTADASGTGPDRSIFSDASAPPRKAVPAATLPTVPTETTPRAKRPAEPGKSASRLLATLEVIAGSVTAGTVFRVEGTEVQIGRGPESDLRLADESVSGTHATLLERDGSWQLLDLGSRNGTYVEGQRITECVLAAGCEIRFGALRLRFHPLG
jgi:pSer/pThr/pTyr-binding forkhead associated (FHA) protein